jgi:hypothetical protein
VPGDSADRGLDVFLGALARSLRGRSRAPVAATQADPARQFSTERVDFFLHLGRTLDLAKLLRLLQLFAKFAQPRLVCRLGLLVQQLAGVAQSANLNSRGLQFFWIRRQSGRRQLRLVVR